MSEMARRVVGVGGGGGQRMGGVARPRCPSPVQPETRCATPESLPSHHSALARRGRVAAADLITRAFLRPALLHPHLQLHHRGSPQRHVPNILTAVIMYACALRMCLCSCVHNTCMYISSSDFTDPNAETLIAGSGNEACNR